MNRDKLRHERYYSEDANRIRYSEVNRDKPRDMKRYSEDEKAAESDCLESIVCTA